MNKNSVNQIEKKAKWLMSLSEAKLRKVPAGSLRFIYYYILEDANFHRANEILMEEDAFRGEYASDSKEYDDYRKSGGRTWQL